MIEKLYFLLWGSKTLYFFWKYTFFENTVDSENTSRENTSKPQDHSSKKPTWQGQSLQNKNSKSIANNCSNIKKELKFTSKYKKEN